MNLRAKWIEVVQVLLPARVAVRISPCVVVTAMLAAVLGGCGSDGDDEGSRQGSPTSATADVDACDVLSEAEVTAAIGPHGPGEQDYLYGGCWWPSTQAPPDAVAWGLRVATSIDDATFEDLADDSGEPLDDLADATYHELDGALWFTCGGAHCVVSAVIDPPEESRAAAVALAGLIRERVRG